MLHSEALDQVENRRNQTAATIIPTDQLQGMQRQIALLQTLQCYSQEITAQLDSPAILGIILEKATALLDALGSSLSIYDPQTQKIHLSFIYNGMPEHQGLTFLPGQGAAGQAIATGQPVIVNDYPHWPYRLSTLDSQPAPYDAMISVPLEQNGTIFGALTVVDRSEHRCFTAEEAQALLLFARFCGVALVKAVEFSTLDHARHGLELRLEQNLQQNAIAQETLRRQASLLQQVWGATFQTQEQERKRIAQDLHDSSNQLITGTLYEIQAVQQRIMGQQGFHTHGDMGPLYGIYQKMERVKTLLRQIETENHRIIYDLYPPILDAEGLIPAIKWLAAYFQDHCQIPCTLVLPQTEPPRLPSRVEMAIYRIVQESLNNVMKHAQAKAVAIRVEFSPAALRLLVEDDGVGFDAAVAGSCLPRRSGQENCQMGLLGLAERAQSIGGFIAVHSTPGQGTQVSFSLPLAQQ